MTAANKKRYNSFITLLLLAVMAVFPYFWQLTNPAPHVINSTVTQVSPCSQTKTSVVQTTCPFQAEFQLQSILPNHLIFFDSITGKIFFVFILGYLATSHQRRIDKPPKI